MNQIIVVSLLSLFGGLFGLLGGFLVLYNERLSKILNNYALSFASGVLITVSLVHLIPDTLEISENNIYIVLFSFFAAFVFDKAIIKLHHHSKKEYKSDTLLVVVGDTIHNALDGIAIASSYLIDPYLGIVVAFATFLHEVPHEISDFGILLKRKWDKSRIILVNIFSSLATLIAAIITLSFIGIAERLSGLALAISAGIFLYLGSSDFLPSISTTKIRGKQLFSLFLGVALMLAVSLVVH